MLRSWVEAGGHPARQEGEAKELLSEVSHIPMFLSFLSPLICLLPAPSQSLVPCIVMCLFLLLIGTETAPGASERRREAKRLEAEAEELEIEGWGKVREAITGSEAERSVRASEGGGFIFPPPPFQTLPLPDPVSALVPLSLPNLLKSPQNPKSRILQALPPCLPQ